MKRLILFLVLLFSNTLYAQDLDKNIALQLIKSTVRVHVESGQGSGVILYSQVSDDNRVKETYVITNKHVVDEEKEAKIERLIYLKNRNTVGVTSYEADVVFVSEHHDLAILKIETAPAELFSPVTLISEDRWDKITLYERLFLVSCGLGNPPYVTQGNLSKVNKRETEMMFTADIIFGSSGGGVYNSSGELVGICNAIQVAGDHHPVSHRAIGIPITTVLKVLRENDYEFLLENESDPKPESESEPKSEPEKSKLRDWF